MKTADRIALACKQDPMFNAFMVSAMIDYANKVLEDKSDWSSRSLMTKEVWQDTAQKAVNLINMED